MIKFISKILLVGFVAATITGCGGASPKEVLDERCHKDGELVPEWVCNSSIEGSPYAAVGIGTSKNESMKVQQAVARARAKLAQQINVQIKAKVEDFMRATGNGEQETLDAVTTTVTKQTSKLDLRGSKKVKEYTARKSGTLYVLVAIDESIVNEKIKETMSSSHNNENALWQQFQSKQALDDLDKEFPTH